MTVTSRTFTVTAPPATVVPYLADFGNAEAWDPGTQTCTRTDAGPVQVGATWHNVSKIMGAKAELTYTLRELTENKIVLVGENDSATSTDSITVEPDGAGSRITYEANLQMHGAAKLLTPAMKLVFEKLGNETQEKMTAVLNGLA